MSRSSHGLERVHPEAEGLNDEAVLRIARRLYGEQAASAIAYSGLDAWFAGDDEAVTRCVRLLPRTGH